MPRLPLKLPNSDMVTQVIQRSSGITSASITGLGFDLVGRAATHAADAGMSSFWAAEATGPESFAQLGAIGASNPSLDLGTGIIPIQLRTPQTVAMGAATLQAMFPKKTIRIGIGVSSPVIVDKWHGASYGDHPLAQIKEYVALMRSCWTGEAVHFDGDYYSSSGFRLAVDMGDKTPEIILGALNPKMLRLAGGIADGVLLNYIPASHVEWSVDQVRKGGQADIYAFVHLGVGETTETTLTYGRKDLYVYASADSYRANFARAGYQNEMEAFSEARSDRNRSAALASISDTMVNEIDTFGDAQTIRSTWQAYIDAGVTHPILMPLPWGTDREETVLSTIDALR